MINLASLFQKFADYFSDEKSYGELEAENAVLRGEVEELEMTVEYLRALR